MNTLKLNVWIMLILSMVLLGCGQTTKPIVAKQTHIATVAVPEPLMTLYPITPPPDREKFISGNDAIRLRMMVEYNIELLEVLGRYRLQTQTLKEYNDEITGKRTDSVRKDR